MTINMRGEGRVNRAYSGIPTFMRADLCLDLDQLNAQAAVFGVPTDEGSPFMPGARFAPRAIREHSMRFAPTGFFDVETQRHYLPDEVTAGAIVDVGDVDVLPTNTEKTAENITAMVRAIRKRGATPVGIGGDHAVSFPIICAFDEPIHVVQFDAHLDYAPVSPDLKHTNGQPFRHIGALPHVVQTVQIGIRSLRVRPVEFRDADEHGNRIVTMQAFRRQSPADVAALVPAGAKCYVSIDIDALDMSLTPGCVSAEPNGLLYHELRDTLVELAKRADIVGFDLVEVNPPLDVGTGVTSYLAAHTMVEFLGHIFAHRKNVR